MPRRSASDPGNLFEVALPDGGLAYGMVIDFPLVAFFDRRFTERPLIANILSCPTAFRIWIMRSCLKRTGWPVIGFAAVPEPLSEPPTFYKFDTVSHRFSTYRAQIEIPATREECLGLEGAAVWSAVHVESRLDDHFAGRPNKWVEQLNPARRGSGR